MCNTYKQVSQVRVAAYTLTWENCVLISITFLVSVISIVVVIVINDYLLHVLFMCYYKMQINVLLHHCYNSATEVFLLCIYSDQRAEVNWFETKYS